MPELLAALDAFVQEHRRCGDLDGGVDGERVWLACDCGGGIVHPVGAWRGARPSPEGDDPPSRGCPFGLSLQFSATAPVPSASAASSEPARSPPSWCPRGGAWPVLASH
jgi:hypothetical protein